MKNSISLLAALLFAASLFATVPEKMSYQAVVRNTKGALVVNQNVGIKISIQKYVLALPKPYYSSIYAETHTPTTNENGLISIAIGTGSVVAGSVNFVDIDWAAETYYLRTDIDISGGTAYTITNTTQLLSVPYALHAKTSENLSPLKIGDSYQGGIIFWLDDTGRHGLIAATTDQSSGVRWGRKTFSTATRTGVYTGESNTTLMLVAEMIDGLTTDNAARLCANYSITVNYMEYNDWYLPSIRELGLLYGQRTVVGNFSEKAYWSSTEVSDEQAFARDFKLGVSGANGKGLSNSVRAIRKF